MNNKKFYITAQGLAELKKEYEELTKVKRPEIVSRVTQARNMGDLSENAEYTAARDQLSFIDGRIDEIEILLKQVTIIQEDKKKNGGNDTVELGSTVTLHINGKKEVYSLVGEWEADPIEKKISHESPLGKALIGKRVGEIAEVEAPAGKISYKIIGIT